MLSPKDVGGEITGIDDTAELLLDIGDSLNEPKTQKNKEYENKDAEIKELKEKKGKKEKDNIIEKATEAVAIDRIKRVLWRSFLGIFIKKYKIEAEKIKLAKIIFRKIQKDDKTKEDYEDIQNKTQEYAKKSSEITKKSTKKQNIRTSWSNKAGKKRSRRKDNKSRQRKK